MKIQRKLSVTVEGATFTFTPASLNDWATISKMGELGFDGQIDLVLSKLVAVDGVQFDDGVAIGLEDIKAKPEWIPGDFYTLLLKSWLEGVTAKIKGEADAGKAPTPA